jgi:hypothetical protein
LSLIQPPVVLLLRRFTLISQLELERIPISRAHPLRLLASHTSRLPFIALFMVSQMPISGAHRSGNLIEQTISIAEESITLIRPGYSSASSTVVGNGTAYSHGTYNTLLMVCLC